MARVGVVATQVSCTPKGGAPGGWLLGFLYCLELSRG